MPLLSSSDFPPQLFHFPAVSAPQPTTSPFRQLHTILRGRHLPTMLAAALPSLRLPKRLEIRLTGDFQHISDIFDHLFAFAWPFMAGKVSRVFMPRGRVDMWLISQRLMVVYEIQTPFLPPAGQYIARLYSHRKPLNSHSAIAPEEAISRQEKARRKRISFSTLRPQQFLARWVQNG